MYVETFGSKVSEMGECAYVRTCVFIVNAFPKKGTRFSERGLHVDE